MLNTQPSQRLQPIIRAASTLSQRELLELIAYLAQQAQSPAVSHHWAEIKQVAPRLLQGEDAQEWVNKTRQANHRDDL